MSANCTVPEDGEQLPAKVNVTTIFDSVQNGIQSSNEDNQQIVFDIDCILCGDIILRCKYYSRFWQRENSLFRISFHTAFIKNNIIVFPKAEIGLANKDERFVFLIFQISFFHSYSSNKIC